MIDAPPAADSAPTAPPSTAAITSKAAAPTQQALPRRRTLRLPLPQPHLRHALTCRHRAKLGSTARRDDTDGIGFAGAVTVRRGRQGLDRIFLRSRGTRARRIARHLHSFRWRRRCHHTNGPSAIPIVAYNGGAGRTTPVLERAACTARYDTQTRCGRSHHRSSGLRPGAVARGAPDLRDYLLRGNSNHCVERRMRNDAQKGVTSCRRNRERNKTKKRW